MYLLLFYMLLNISQASIYLISASCLFILLFCLFLLFFFKVKQKQTNLIMKQQQQKNDYEQLLLKTQLEIQEETLKNVSEEIHDNVGQVLSLVKLNLNTLHIGNEDKIIDTKHLVSKAIGDLRNLSRSMHGGRIADIGLQQSIADALLLIQNTGQFYTKLIVEGAAYKLEQHKEMVLFRIVQEATNNAVKYSKAASIKITITYLQDKFKLVIEDDGIGFNTGNLSAANKGIGLSSMRDRAKLIGGEFSLISMLDKGTTITLLLKKEKVIASVI
jgi:two-component system, NarL family, sensor kinase